MPEGRISLGPVIQVGFIVHDCEASSQRWTTLFELPPARVVGSPARRHDRGAPRLSHRPADEEVAFIETPNVQLEFIQPLEPNNIYAEFLDQHGEGIHHILFDVPDPEAAAARMGVDGTKAATRSSRAGMVFPRHPGDVWLSARAARPGK